MIIIDLSQLLNAAVFHDMKENGTKEPTLNGIRFYVLNKIRLAKQKFKKEFGSNIVIATDKKSWRYSKFELYKHKRKKKRDSDDLDWSIIHKYFDEIINEIKEYFPYRVLYIDGCEGDDIVAVLVKHINEPVVIIGQDKDYFQLHGKKNLKQYCPVKDKFLDFEESEIPYNLFSHVCRGDDSDGIPNILSDADTFVCDDKKQNRLMETYIKKLFILNDEELEEELGEYKYKRYLENKILIDFNHIPYEIESKILDEYHNYKFGKNQILSYIMKLRSRPLLNVINDF